MGDKTDRGQSKKRMGADKGRKSSPGAEALIARQLKAMYDEVIAQPVPDRLLELLKRIDDGGAKK